MFSPQSIADAQRPKRALAKYIFPNLRPNATPKVWAFPWSLRFYSGRAPWT